MFEIGIVKNSAKIHSQPFSKDHRPNTVGNVGLLHKIPVYLKRFCKRGEKEVKRYDLKVFLQWGVLKEAVSKGVHKSRR